MIIDICIGCRDQIIECARAVPQHPQRSSACAQKRQRNVAVRPPMSLFAHVVRDLPVAFGVSSARTRRAVRGRHFSLRTPPS
eukprot:4253540-Prymnesium_polylepis.1